MATTDDLLHDDAPEFDELRAVRAAFWSSDVTLTEALRERGFTHRPAANQLLIGAREIVNAAGEVVFTGRAGGAWDWLTRLIATTRRDVAADDAYEARVESAIDDVAPDKYRGEPEPPISGDDELRRDNPRDWSDR